MRCQSSPDAHETKPWVAAGQTVEHAHGLFISAGQAFCRHLLSRLPVTVVLRPHMQIEIFSHQDGPSIKFSNSGDRGLCRIICYYRCCNAV